MPDSKTPNLYQRLLRIMGELTHIKKGGKADSSVGGYAFVKHDDVMAAVQPLLVKHGVAMVASAKERDGSPYQVGQTKGGNPIWRTVLDVQLVLLNADDPSEALQTSAVGYGDDSGDKGPGKAYSYGMKTGLQKLLCLPAGDEGDNEAHDRGGYQAAPRQAPKAGSGAGTDAQVRKLWATVKDQGLTQDQVADYVQVVHNSDSTKTLSKAALSDCIEWAMGWRGQLDKAKTYLAQAGYPESRMESTLQREAARLYSTDKLHVLTLEQWAALVQWCDDVANEEVPFGAGPDEPPGQGTL